MTRRKLQAAAQQLYAPVELAKVHIAEAQVAKKIGIVGILAEEFLQVDAGLVELAGLMASGSSCSNLGGLFVFVSAHSKSYQSGHTR